MNRRGRGNISTMFSGGAPTGGGATRGAFRAPRGGRGGSMQIAGRANQDGDVDMLGGAGNRMRNRGNNPYGASGRARAAPSQGPSPTDYPIEVSIRGWKGNSDHTALFDFLKGKSAGRFEILSHRFFNEDIYIKVRNASQASHLQKLSGIRYAGGKLLISIRGAIRPTDPSGVPLASGAPAPSSGVIQTLSNILRNRYNPDVKFLNLESLGSDPMMLSDPALSGFGTDSLETSKLGPVICKMIGQQFPDVLTISFKSNHLTSLRPFQTLPNHVPLIQNLSFHDNLIQNYRDLEVFKGKDLPNLRELILFGNPFRERELKKPGGDADYRRKIKDMFPSIKLLDEIEFAEEIGFDFGVKEEDGFPVTEKLSFMDLPDTADMMQDFVVKFFKLFDTHRAGLMDLYSDNAVFSLSINPSPRRTGPNPSRPLNVHGWLPFNRNHHEKSTGAGKDVSKRASMLSMGPQQIIQTFSKLPTTLHRTNFNPEKKLYVVDAFQLPMSFGVAVVATVYGDFFHEETNVNHSFTRTFTFIPAPPGSRAAMSGWPYTILNDQFVLRGWVFNKVWIDYEVSPQSAVPRVGPLVGDPNAGLGQSRSRQQNSGGSSQQMGATPPMTSNGPLSLLGGPEGALPDTQGLMILKNAYGLNDMQHSLVLQFAQSTGLNYQYAHLCLSEVNWDGNGAMQVFSNARANIPPNAFQFIGLAPQV